MNDHVDAPVVINPLPTSISIALVATRKASMRLVIDDLGIACKKQHNGLLDNEPLSRRVEIRIFFTNTVRTIQFYTWETF